jgi:hypothetical protein
MILHFLILPAKSLPADEVGWFFDIMIDIFDFLGILIYSRTMTIPRPLKGE